MTDNETANKMLRRAAGHTVEVPAPEPAEPKPASTDARKGTGTAPPQQSTPTDPNDLLRAISARTGA